ncbi:hypothetical protein [Streptomyces sp. NPDC054961]
MHEQDPPAERYVKICNRLAQHGELSLTAIGLSIHIQSLPTGAPVSIKALSARFSEGETRIAAALREQEAHGYLSRTRERLPSGQVVTRTVSYNVPLALRSAPPGRVPAPAPAWAPVRVAASEPAPAKGPDPGPDPDLEPDPEPDPDPDPGPGSGPGSGARPATEAA